MERDEIHLIGIGYAKDFFDTKSREHTRARKYSEALGSYTAIVFTDVEEQHSVVDSGNFRAIPTRSTSKVRKLVDAYRIGKRILKEHPERHYIVTSQDPFETSVVGYVLARASTATHHIQIHGSFFSGTEWVRESFLNRIRFHIGLFLLRRATCIRVVSERIKASLTKRGISEHRITVLPVRTELSEYLRIERKSIRKEGRITVLFAGRLAPEKNIGLLIRSFSAVAQTHNTVDLRIVGDGPERKALETQVVALDLSERVTFVGRVPTLVEEMERADLFCLCSNHEGYGLVLVEAMAAGLPVLTTDVGCAGEVLKDGVHGVVVPVRDERAYREALQRLIGDHTARQEMGARGREAVLETVEVSEETYINRWVDAYRMCTSKV